MEVVGTEALPVLLGIQVKTFVGLCNQPLPTLMLGIEIEAVVGIQELHQLLPEFIVSSTLHLHQFVGQEHTDLLGRVSITQVVAHIRRNLIEHLIGQGLGIFLSLREMSYRLAHSQVGM